MADGLNEIPIRLTDEVDMENTRDWLSRLLEMMPVKGTLDYRCFLGAPWRMPSLSYQSEAAFQRAFKHQMGITPAQWRRTPGRPAAERLGLHRDGDRGKHSHTE